MKAMTRRAMTAASLQIAAMSASPGPARANQVTVAEGLGCDVGCVDTYEVRCKKASRYVCVVSVFSRWTTAAGDRQYEINAECSKGNLFGAEPIVSTQTTMVRKQDE